MDASVRKLHRWGEKFIDWLRRRSLCHSNETWHALNSTFPDTNCIVSFHINPHWISNSGLWKSSTTVCIFKIKVIHFQNKGNPFSNVLGHAWHTWCKKGTNGKRMSCSLLIGHMQIFKSIDFRTMGLWKWITFNLIHTVKTFRKWWGNLAKGILLHQDKNATASKSVVAMAAVHDCGLNWLITLHIFLIWQCWHHLTFTYESVGISNPCMARNASALGHKA